MWIEVYWTASDEIQDLKIGVRFRNLFLGRRGVWGPKKAS